MGRFFNRDDEIEVSDRDAVDALTQVADEQASAILEMKKALDEANDKIDALEKSVSDEVKEMKKSFEVKTSELEKSFLQKTETMEKALNLQGNAPQSVLQKSVDDGGKAAFVPQGKLPKADYLRCVEIMQKSVDEGSLTLEEQCKMDGELQKSMQVGGAMSQATFNFFKNRIGK